MEQWKEIFGYGGRYFVSDHGRVQNSDGLVLRYKPTAGGYRRITLRRDNKPRSFMVHRLVATAFIGERPSGKEVNHRDGNKKNNHYSNLEWVTKSENKLHSIRLGLSDPTANLPKNTSGSHNGRAIITLADVLEIRRQRKARTDDFALAAKYGIRPDYVASIARGLNWKNAREAA